MADKRDDFLINLNNCRSEINTKFKQISDNLVIRQKQLLTELDGIEKKYSESRNAENLLKPTEEYRNKINKGLQGSFLPENIISNIRLIIDNLGVQIADLRQKLVTYTNIDIVLNTDSINTLIDKLGSVILTEDTIIPETGIPNSQSTSYKESMVQYNAPFNLNKNEYQKNKVTAPNQDVNNNTIKDCKLKDCYLQQIPGKTTLHKIETARNQIREHFRQDYEFLARKEAQQLREIEDIDNHHQAKARSELMEKEVPQVYFSEKDVEATDAEVKLKHINVDKAIKTGATNKSEAQNINLLGVVNPLDDKEKIITKLFKGKFM